MDKRGSIALLFLIVIFAIQGVEGMNVIDITNATLYANISIDEFSSKDKFAFSTWIKQGNMAEEYNFIIGIYRQDKSWYENSGLTLTQHSKGGLRLVALFGNGSERYDHIMVGILPDTWNHIGVIFNGSQLDYILNGQVKRTFYTNNKTMNVSNGDYKIKMNKAAGNQTRFISETAFWFGGTVPNREELGQYARGEVSIPGGYNRYYN